MEEQKKHVRFAYRDGKLNAVFLNELFLSVFVVHLSCRRTGSVWVFLKSANLNFLLFFLRKTSPSTFLIHFCVFYRLCLQYADEPKIRTPTTRYNGMLDALKKIYHSEGVIGLYRVSGPDIVGARMRIKCALIM